MNGPLGPLLRSGRLPAQTLLVLHFLGSITQHYPQPQYNSNIFNVTSNYTTHTNNLSFPPLNSIEFLSHLLYMFLLQSVLINSTFSHTSELADLGLLYSASRICPTSPHPASFRHKLPSGAHTRYKLYYLNVRLHCYLPWHLYFFIFRSITLKLYSFPSFPHNFPSVKTNN